MSLNHPKTITPPLVHGKIVFQKTGPWCQKGWGPLLEHYWRSERGSKPTPLSSRYCYYSSFLDVNRK